MMIPAGAQSRPEYRLDGTFSEFSPKAQRL